MDAPKKLKFKNIYGIILIAFSIYMLYAAIGILLNSGINLKYDATSLEDVMYVHFYAKLLIAYIVFVIPSIFFLMKR